MNKSRFLFFLFIALIIITPLVISRYFFNANDLPKSSVIMIIGGLFIAVFAALLIFQIVNHKGSTVQILLAPKPDISVLFFLLAIVLSTLFSIKPIISFWGQYERQVGLITYIYLTAIYFISGIILNQLHKRKIILIITELVAVVISLIAIMQFFQLDPFSIQPFAQRTVSTLGNAVFVGGFLILAFPFSALNASGKTNIVLRVLCPFVIVLGIIVSGTRSAYIALFAQFMIISFIKRSIFLKKFNESKKLFLLFSLIFMIFVFIFLFLINEGVLFRRITEILTFSNPRLILWKDAFNIFCKYPVTGSGIAMFPAAFEEFYSNTLRFADAKVVYDNAHNNFLQILFTAGLSGLIAYIFMIYTAFKTSVNFIKSSGVNEIDKTISLSIIIMLSGYAVYGLTNFDDISILFYLFIYLSILRSILLKKKEIYYTPILKFGATALLIILAMVSIMNIPLTVKKLSADRNFNNAGICFTNGNFKEGVEYNNRAIDLNPGCSAYRYYEAAQVYEYCFNNQKLSNDAKHNLLQQVEGEINKAKDNLYYINICNGLLSLVYYEEGKIEEAEKLKNEVLEKDSINVNFRIQLTRYLLKENRLEEAKRCINVFLLMKPDETICQLLTAVYYNKILDKGNAIFYSNKVLLLDPNNKTALDIINGYNEKK